MGWLRGNDGVPEGWVKAPRDVELEIRGVWQEDDMPAELRDAPGYAPFTLGAAAQAWVDSMEDGKIVDGGTCVYGRPRPRTVQQHRSLATPGASTSSPDPQVRQAPAVTPQPKPASPHVLMHDIGGSAPSLAAPPPLTQSPKILDIGGPPPRPATGSRMSNVGRTTSHSGQPVRTLPPRILMPDIDAPESVEPAPRGPLMPDVGDAGPSPRNTAQHSPQMPDIADDEPRRSDRPLMPDIG